MEDAGSSAAPAHAVVEQPGQGAAAVLLADVCREVLAMPAVHCAAHIPGAGWVVHCDKGAGGSDCVDHRCGGVPSPDREATQAAAAEMNTEAVAAKASRVRDALRSTPALATMRINAQGKTLLHKAAVAGCAASVDVLLEARADPNAVDGMGASPLHWASSKGHERLAQSLLQHGADVRMLDDTNLSPLHCAASLGFSGVVELCLRCGAQVDTVSTAGWMPLHSAARGGNLRIVRFLLDHAAPTDVAVDNTTTASNPAAQTYQRHRPTPV